METAVVFPVLCFWPVGFALLRRGGEEIPLQQLDKAVERSLEEKNKYDEDEDEEGIRRNSLSLVSFQLLIFIASLSATSFSSYTALLLLLPPLLLLLLLIQPSCFIRNRGAPITRKLFCSRALPI